MSDKSSVFDVVFRVQSYKDSFSFQGKGQITFEENSIVCRGSSGFPFLWKIVFFLPILFLSFLLIAFIDSSGGADAAGTFSLGKIILGFALGFLLLKLFDLGKSTVSLDRASIKPVLKAGNSFTFLAVHPKSHKQKKLCVSIRDETQVDSFKEQLTRDEPKSKQE